MENFTKNKRQLELETVAATLKNKINWWMVGAIGFEPTTYGTQNRRATRLRHAPNISDRLAL